MNNRIPSWNFESDTRITNHRKPTWNDHEIVELLWQNGQVVMHNQSTRKSVGNSSDLRQVQKTDGSTLRTSGGNSSKLSQEDVTVPWIQYQIEDPLEQELCANLLSEELVPCEVEIYKPIKQLEEGNFVKSIASSAPQVTSSSQSLNIKPSCVQKFQGNPMPAPRFHAIDSSQKINDFGGSQKVLNFPHFSAPHNGSSASASAQLEKVNANLSQSEAKECSVMTVGSSHCGSNQIPQDPDLSRASSNGVWATTLSSERKDYVQREIPGSDKGKSEMVEPIVTSSSGGSGSSIGRTCSLSTTNHGQKGKKGTNAEASEEQSEAATEIKSADRNNASHRARSSKRSRAAEVHNLSERKRQDP